MSIDAPGPARRVLRRLPLGLRRRIDFAYGHHRLPHFRHPSTFSDKVNWRILYDRRPLLAWTCDKLAMKEHARDLPGLRIPRTLWSGVHLSELHDLELPERWVLKPNHRSQLIHFGAGPADVERLERTTASWLAPLQARELGEWAYSQARPAFLVEEALGWPNQSLPDYKFLVFAGDPAFVMVNSDRFTDHQLRFYRPDWTPLEVTWGHERLSPPAPAPSNLADMLSVAARLGRDFDFIRIDLYSVEGETVFGEYTPYPAGGLERFRPSSFDRQLGALWQLPGG